MEFGEDLASLQFDSTTTFTQPSISGILVTGLPKRVRPSSPKRQNEKQQDERQSMIDVAKPRHTSAETNLTSVSDQLSDEQIMQQITQGDSAALEILYDRYAPLIMGVALKMLNSDRATAEEVVQETFWRVWKRSASFNEKSGKPASWVVGIARNLCVDTWRRRKSRPQPVFSEDDVERAKNQPDPHTNVAEAVWTSIKHSQVKVALTVLPEEQRKVIEMAYFGGMTRQEISKTLDVPLGTVHTRARLGLKKLRDILQNQDLAE